MTQFHASQPILNAGPAPQRAAATIVMLHGRGASADDMLSLYDALAVDDLAAVAPQAAGNSWYPNSFLAPIPANQPFLDSALSLVESIVNDLLTGGIDVQRIALLGFSQGACLTLESVARHPRIYGAVIGLTGGLIGPPGTPRNYPGSLKNVPVFLGTSDPDPHVPFYRVKETQTVLSQMGANVELRRYPGMPHTISDEELAVSRDLLLQMIDAPQP
jgi:phospholipase/carboxylesterase